MSRVIKKENLDAIRKVELVNITREELDSIIKRSNKLFQENSMLHLKLKEYEKCWLCRLLIKLKYTP